jgi:predicted metal-dependent hydrolase
MEEYVEKLYIEIISLLISLLPTYRHIVNNNLKNTYLTFDDKANLVIKSPQISDEYLEKILLKKALWIRNTQEKIRQKKGKVLLFKEGEELYFYGQAYPLSLKKHTKKRTKLIFLDEKFTLFYSEYDEVLFQKNIDNFYLQKAKDYIPSMVEKWSEVMQLEYSKISFRKTKRQWGSCSSKNNLSFNTMLIKLPKDVIQYIIVHELAHIKYKHHQKSFWSFVESYLPNYKEQIAQLKKYTT